MKQLISHKAILIDSTDLLLLTIKSSFCGMFVREYEEVVKFTVSGALIYPDGCIVEDSIIRQLIVSMAKGCYD